MLFPGPQQQSHFTQQPRHAAKPPHCTTHQSLSKRSECTSPASQPTQRRVRLTSRCYTTTPRRRFGNTRLLLRLPSRYAAGHTCIHHMRILTGREQSSVYCLAFAAWPERPGPGPGPGLPALSTLLYSAAHSIAGRFHLGFSLELALSLSLSLSLSLPPPFVLSFSRFTTASGPQNS